jgi:acetaldehyde/propanal dehydrogenase
MNVNMISCAGQATIPIVNAISRVQPVEYGEIVASLASKSIGPGTRANLDEFTYTTSNAIERVGGAKKGKALAIINPAEPPMIMRNTINCLTETEPDQQRIIDSVLAMIEEVQKYVPGYRLVNGPLFDGKRVAVFMEVGPGRLPAHLRRQPGHHDRRRLPHRRDVRRGNPGRHDQLKPVAAESAGAAASA